MSRIARTLAAIAIASASLGLAGCGAIESDPGSIGGLDKPSAAQQREDYEQAMERMRTTLEDPNAAPLERSINRGNRAELLAAAKRWDDATAIAASIEAPEDIRTAHRDLVAAMKQLGDWNRRIAAAAPNARRTAQLGKQARASAAAKAFTEAVDAIERKGYHVMTPAEQDSALSDAPPPTG